MSKIVQVKAIQIFDSRGTPTISCKVILDNGMEGIAMVPSGASTGSKEALELRDSEIKYHGKGVLNAVNNINNILGPLIVGNDPIQQEKIDQSLIDRDGTNDKSQLGANSILAISIAVSRVAASLKGISLHEHFSDLYKDMTGEKPQQSLPMPMLNILNGGEHADNNIDIQEFMIIPSGAESFTQAMQWSSEVYINLKEILHSMKLSTSGINVEVYEQHEKPGGKIRYFDSKVGPIDAGPTVLTMYNVFADLFHSCGYKIDEKLKFIKEEIIENIIIFLTFIYPLS